MTDTRDIGDKLDSLVVLLDDLHDPVNHSGSAFTINLRGGRSASVWESSNDGGWKWSWET